MSVWSNIVIISPCCSFQALATHRAFLLTARIPAKVGEISTWDFCPTRKTCNLHTNRQTVFASVFVCLLLSLYFSQVSVARAILGCRDKLHEPVMTETAFQCANDGKNRNSRNERIEHGGDFPESDSLPVGSCDCGSVLVG